MYRHKSTKKLPQAVVASYTPTDHVHYQHAATRYTTFVIEGDLPPCEAHQLQLLTLAPQSIVHQRRTPQHAKVKSQDEELYKHSCKVSMCTTLSDYV